MGGAGNRREGGSKREKTWERRTGGRWCVLLTYVRSQRRGRENGHNRHMNVINRRRRTGFGFRSSRRRFREWRDNSGTCGVSGSISGSEGNSGTCVEGRVAAWTLHRIVFTDEPGG